MKESLQVKVREQLGTRQTRRLRQDGLVPAILYGHGEKNVSLSVPAVQVKHAVRHGARLVDLSGDVTETALIREVQWDAFGIDVLHLDLARVSADETVEVTLPIELRGAAPGSREGGVVEHVKHEARILCPVVSLPERLELSINNLHLEQSLTLADLTLPAGASIVGDADEIVVHCVKPKTAEEEAAAGGGAEPEVIGRKKADEEGAADEA
ncbi:MAG: 50S ribosomal protein L25 [Pirellulales bacterium]